MAAPGKAARNWAFVRGDCPRDCKALKNDETLLVPVRQTCRCVSHPRVCARVLIANSNLVGAWPTGTFHELERAG